MKRFVRKSTFQESKLNERVQICDSHVVEYENYRIKLEWFQDWLRSLKAAVDTSVDPGDTEGLKMKLIALSIVLSALEEGDQKLEELQSILKAVLKYTDPKGHPAFLSELALEKELYHNFVKLCQAARDSIQDSLQDRSNCENVVSYLEQWLVMKDHILREQVLCSSLEAKVTQLQSLKDLEAEILAKQSDMSSLNSRVEQLRGDSSLITRISKILNKHQTLKDTAKESVRKWDLYVKEHESFESKLAEITQWLEEPEKKLKECSILIGDIPTLQERKSFLESLSDQLSQNLCHIESTIELGERLYSSTSPEEREIIRQKIGNLQKQYENLIERCNAALRAADSCLQKLSSFTQGQERLSKCLQEVGLAVQQHTEPTLQEKRVQLQSQKFCQELTDTERERGILYCFKSDGSTNVPFIIKKDQLIIGSGHGCDIRIYSKDVSNEHTVITFNENGQGFIESPNKDDVFLNGGIVTNKRTLQHYDIISIGKRLFQFYYTESSEFYISTAAAAFQNNTQIQADRVLAFLPKPLPAQIEAIEELLMKIHSEHGLQEEDMVLRQKLATRFTEFVQTHLTDCSVEMTGSSVTGLGLKNSKVDFSFRVQEEKDIPDALELLYKKLSSDPAYCDVVSVFKKKRLGILFTDKETGLECSLVLENVVTDKFTKLFSLYAELDPRVKILASCFRYWAKICLLDNQDRGTLPPYTYCILLVYFLQQIDPPVLPVLHEVKTFSYVDFVDRYVKAGVWKSENNSSIGELWIQLFYFYNFTYEMGNHVVCVRSSDILLCSERSWATKFYAIEDPFSRRNIAHVIPNYPVAQYIQHCFMKTYRYFAIPRTKDGEIPLLKSDEFEQRLHSFLSFKYEASENLCDDSDASDNDDSSIPDESNFLQDFEDQDPDIPVEDVISTVKRMKLDENSAVEDGELEDLTDQNSSPQLSPSKSDSPKKEPKKNKEKSLKAIEIDKVRETCTWDLKNHKDLTAKSFVYQMDPKLCKDRKVELQQKIIALNKSLEDYKHLIKISKKAVDEARLVCQIQMKLTEEHQHCSAEKLKKLSEKLEVSEQALNESRRSWSRQEEILEKENKALRRQLLDLETCNRNLHEQLNLHQHCSAEKLEKLSEKLEVSEQALNERGSIEALSFDKDCDNEVTTTADDGFPDLPEVMINVERNLTEERVNEISRVNNEETGDENMSNSANSQGYLLACGTIFCLLIVFILLIVLYESLAK